MKVRGLKVADGVPLIGELIVSKKTEADRASEAALRTADALRQTALNPAIAQADRPVMLMMALGWEEYARQLLREVH